MKRLIILLAILILPLSLAADMNTYIIGSGVAAGGGGTWTYVNSSVGGFGYSTQQLTGVTAGNTIVVVATWAGDATDATISDGTSSFTMTTRQSGVGGTSVQIGYLLACTANGTVTYTVTFPGSATALRVAVWEFSHSATASYDTSAGNAASSSTAVNTGNITISDTDVLVVAAHRDYTAVGSSGWQINGENADGTLGTANETRSWYSIENASWTGAATCTLNDTGHWVAAVIALKIE